MATTFTSMIDLVYPVNSIYLSWSSSFSPATSFGGTWSRLTAGKMLRTGTGNATGGNDVHSHVYAVCWCDFYGALTYNNNNINSLFYVGNWADIKGNTVNGTYTDWGAANILQRNPTVLTGPWTNRGTYNEGGGYYVTGGHSTTVYGKTTPNLAYKPFTSNERAEITNDVHSSGLKYFEGTANEDPITIPAYQTINTWRRTA